jgi:hypothetical protein
MVNTCPWLSPAAREAVEVPCGMSVCEGPGARVGVGEEVVEAVGLKTCGVA